MKAGGNFYHMLVTTLILLTLFSSNVVASSPVRQSSDRFEYYSSVEEFLTVLEFISPMMISLKSCVIIQLIPILSVPLF